MDTVVSTDGTTIAYDRLGSGPPVVLIGGGPTDRMAQAELAGLLSAGLTVYNYDRRGRGDSGDTAPFAVEREYEDLAAVIGAAGGSAGVYGSSGGAILALRAAMYGVPIARLALWEPPFTVSGARSPAPADWGAHVAKLVAAGQRGDAIEYWMVDVVGMPREIVAPIRQAPFWSAMEAVAHTLPYDAAIVGDFSIPAELGAISAPTLLLDGDVSFPWIRRAVDEVAAALPDVEQRTLAGQAHNVAADALAPVLLRFFGA